MYTRALILRLVPLLKQGLTVSIRQFLRQKKTSRHLHFFMIEDRSKKIK